MKTLRRILGVLCLGCLNISAATPFTAPIVPADPAGAGRELVAHLLSLRPAESITNEAVLSVQVKKITQFEAPMRITVCVSETNWSTTYLANPQNGANQSSLCITRSVDGANQYQIRLDHGDSTKQMAPSGEELMQPFSGSDFWLADLGMEFLRWPTQRLLKKEMCRNQSCDKLESIAPAGQTNGYVRVVAWFDIDTGGPVLVEAYDGKGEFVKEFKPNKFTKVNGQWQVEELEMNNLRTGSRSYLHFKLGDK